MTPTTWQKIQNTLNGVNHFFIIGMGTAFTLHAYNLGFKDTAMHMFLAGTGFHVLSAEAMMSHWPANPLTRRLSYRNKSRLHGALQFLGGSMVLLGSVGKISQTKVHFTTLHGKLGLLATFMCVASIIGGIVNYFHPKLAMRVYSPSQLKLRHNFFGIVTFTLGMATIYMGYNTKFALRTVPNEMLPTLMKGTMIVYSLSIFAPVKSLLHKISLRLRR